MCALAKQSPFVTCDCNPRPQCGLYHPQQQSRPLASSAAGSESSSVFDPCAQGQETGFGGGSVSGYGLSETDPPPVFNSFSFYGESSPAPSSTSRTFDVSVTEENGF